MGLSVDLPAHALARLRAEATRRGVSIDDVVTALAKTLPDEIADSAVPRRRLSFAGTLEAEEDFAVRSEQILDKIVRRAAG